MKNGHSHHYAFDEDCIRRLPCSTTSPPLSPSPFHGSTSLTVLSLSKDGEGEIGGEVKKHKSFAPIEGHSRW